MNQGSTSRQGSRALAVAIAALAWGAVACKPMSDGSSTNCLLYITADAGSSGQQPLSATQAVAEAFVQPTAASTTPSTLSLKLQSILSGSTGANGTVAVGIYPDSATGSTTPTTPAASSASAALAGGEISASSISSNSPAFYSVALTWLSTTGLTAGSVYWIVAAATYNAGPPNIVWDGSGGVQYSSGFASTGSGNPPTTWTAITPATNMAIQLCP